MNIGFFADDSSASHAALLANNALCRADASKSGVLAGGYNIVDVVPAYLDEASERGRHLMLALPLAQLGNASVRRRLDLSVVTFGAEPLAHDGARRAMASKAAQPTDAQAPPWMLASGGKALPAGPRALPVRTGSLRRDEVASLRAGCTCGSLHWRAVGLAAALRIAADDPYAAELDRARVVEAMTEGATVAEMRLRDDLLDLAVDLDEHPVDPGAHSDRRRLASYVRSARRGTGRMVRTGRTVIASQLPAARHSADCVCSARV